MLRMVENQPVKIISKVKVWASGGIISVTDGELRHWDKKFHDLLKFIRGQSATTENVMMVLKKMQSAELILSMTDSQDTVGIFISFVCSRETSQALGEFKSAIAGFFQFFSEECKFSIREAYAKKLDELQAREKLAQENERVAREQAEARIALLRKAQIVETTHGERRPPSAFFDHGARSAPPQDYRAIFQAAMARAIAYYPPLEDVPQVEDNRRLNDRRFQIDTFCTKLLPELLKNLSVYLQPSPALQISKELQFRLENLLFLKIISLYPNDDGDCKTKGLCIELMAVTLFELMKYPEMKDKKIEYLTIQRVRGLEHARRDVAELDPNQAVILVGRQDPSPNPALNSMETWRCWVVDPFFQQSYQSEGIPVKSALFQAKISPNDWKVLLSTSIPVPLAPYGLQAAEPFIRSVFESSSMEELERNIAQGPSLTMSMRLR